MELDYWLAPRGKGVFIDEDELLAPLDQERAAQIEATRQHLLRHAVDVAAEIGERSKAFITSGFG